MTPQSYILFQFTGCFHYTVSVKANFNTTYLTLTESEPDLEEKPFIEITGAPENALYYFYSFRLCPDINSQLCLSM